jgi:hypothetical protein
MAVMGCGAPAAVTSTMSEKQRGDLESSFATLDDTLSAKSPFIFTKLQPGASDSEISVLRTGLSGASVDCLERWFRWHNGCRDNITDVLPLGRMLSISESLEDRKQIQTVPFADSKRKSALKILADAAGDGFFLDIASSGPRVFYHMLEDPFPTDYGTLQEFVTFVSKIHAAGLASKNEHGMVAFDLERYQVMEAEYLRSLK